MRRSAAMISGLLGAFVALAVVVVVVWPDPWDVRCKVASDVDLAFFEGATARLLPSQRAGFEATGEVLGGELLGTGDIGDGAAVVAVDRAQVVVTDLRGGRCREPLRLVPRSAEVAGVVLGSAHHLEGCGVADEESQVDPRDDSFFFYGEPGPCELRACLADGTCGGPLRLTLEHERSIIVELEAP